ncbi:hypothetical protein HAX54_045664 [Datura stramonium]|uniref:Cyclin N-terminal domain-containing protein n=1 Tax=Datura stramonium TaxID=4076 RepID=A0ABS8RPR4_DATST|nr:hypothetical protein [Datura stramonium]
MVNCRRMEQERAWKRVKHQVPLTKEQKEGDKYQQSSVNHLKLLSNVDNGATHYSTIQKEKHDSHKNRTRKRASHYMIENRICRGLHNYTHGPSGDCRGFENQEIAAQIASSQQHCSEENKKPKIAAESFSVWEDIPLSDMEENEAAKDQPEIEMEDIFEETIIDIDGNDAKNPLAAVEYVKDLLCQIKRKMEGEFSSVHHKFELREETLFLTVNLIDRFLEKQDVVRKKLQLFGLRECSKSIVSYHQKATGKLNRGYIGNTAYLNLAM